MKRTAVALASFVLTGLAVSGGVGLANPERRHQATVRTQPAQPDQVVQWNQILLALIQAPGAQPATIHPTRTLAITQLAVYDAVNAVDGGHAPYLFHGRAARDASAPAAAAAAARTALLSLLPTQASAIDAAYQASLAQLGSSHRVQEGISVGERAAAAILAARAGDGAAVTPTPYVPLPGPGEYQLTPPTFAPAAFTQVAHVTPFVLLSARQFRSAPPPALTSERYARDFAQVEALGELSSTVRTAEQTTIGKFWGAAPIWIVWNQIAEQAGLAFHNTLAANARMFAVLDTTLADSAIALYDAKYAYHRWRPVTAITALDQGNPTTMPNPAWLPLANTAPDPSYPGAHAAFSRAAATVLQGFFGTNHDVFSLTNATSGITRHFEGFSQAASEASASRVFAGQHFAYDEVAGQALGREVAEFDLSKLLLPRDR